MANLPPLLGRRCVDDGIDPALGEYSAAQEFQNKLSQSLLLTEAAFNQLKKLREEHF